MSEITAPGGCVATSHPESYARVPSASGGYVSRRSWYCPPAYDYVLAARSWSSPSPTITRAAITSPGLHRSRSAPPMVPLVSPDPGFGVAGPLPPREHERAVEGRAPEDEEEGRPGAAASSSRSATASSAAGNANRAAERYEQAAPRRPHAATPRVRLAQIALARGQYTEAADHLREAMTAEPGWLSHAPDIQRSTASPPTSPPDRQARVPPPGRSRRPRRLARPRRRVVSLGPDPAGGRRLPPAHRPQARPHARCFPRRLHLEGPRKS